MKKILIALLVLSMVLTAAACGQTAQKAEAETTANAAAATEAPATAEPAQAEATAEPTAEPTATPVPDPTATYDQVVADYRKAIEDQLPGTTLAAANMNTEIVLLYAEENPLTKLGYYRRDIDGDGIDELFIGPVYNEDSHNKGMIYHLLTYDVENDTYKDLFVGNQNDRLFLCNDGTFVRAFAPADGVTEYCMLDDSFKTTGIIQGQGSSVPEYNYDTKQFVIKDTTTWTKIDGDGGEGSVVSTLTDDQVVDAIEALYESYMEIPYTPLSEN